MQLINVAAAQALATHRFRKESDSSMRVCVDCGLSVPCAKAAVSYQVANVRPCPGAEVTDGQP